MKGVGRKVGGGRERGKCKVLLVHFTEEDIQVGKDEAKLSNLHRISWQAGVKNQR